jgi:high mobility group protein B3
MSIANLINNEFNSMIEKLNEKIAENVKAKKSQEPLLQFVAEMKEHMSSIIANACVEKEEKKVEKKAEKVEKKKKAAKKDDGAPKRPLSSYMIFCQENREDIVAKHPEASAKDIMSIFGAEWKNADKSKYEEKAAKMKEQYNAAMEKWKAENSEHSEHSEDDNHDNHSEDEEEKPKKSKKSKSSKSDDDSSDEQKPKRPVSPYILFCSEKREEVKAEYPDMKPTEITRKLGEMWRALSEEEQTEYKNKAKNQ